MRFSTSSRLWRASGTLQTWTSYALPPRKMSPTSSPAISVDAARRTSPGFKPYRSAAARSTSTVIWGTSVSCSACCSVEAVHAEHDLLDLGRLLPQHVEVLTVDADDDGLAGAGQHLPDALLQVGLHVTADPRIAVDHLLDPGQRLVVGRRGVDADPVLTELRAHRLVRDERLADVGAEVAHARDGLELLGGLRW